MRKFQSWERALCLQTKHGEETQLHDVFYAPGMKHNLLSIRQMVKNGYRVLMEKGECIIYDRDGSKRAMVTVQMTKNWMFSIKMQIPTQWTSLQ